MNAYELADILHQSDFLAMDFAEDAATMLRKLADEKAELEKGKWLTEIQAKQQALKQIIDWLTIEHDTLACTSYPMRRTK